MGDDRRETADGRQPMGNNNRWEMTDGRQQMGDSRFLMGFGTVYSIQRMADGRIYKTSNN